MKAIVVSVRLWIYLCVLKYTNNNESESDNDDELTKDELYDMLEDAKEHFDIKRRECKALTKKLKALRKAFDELSASHESLKEDHEELGMAHKNLEKAHSSLLKPPLAWLIQNGFTGEAKAGEARKTGFFWLLAYFNLSLQNGFTLQFIDLRKIDEAEAGISRAKEALSIQGTMDKKIG